MHNLSSINDRLKSAGDRSITRSMGRGMSTLSDHVNRPANFIERYTLFGILLAVFVAGAILTSISISAPQPSLAEVRMNSTQTTIQTVSGYQMASVKNPVSRFFGIPIYAPNYHPGTREPYSADGGGFSVSIQTKNQLSS